MKSIILYLFFAVVLSACFASKEISGEYSSRRMPYVFNLNKDSTFFYRYRFQFDTEYSLGRWHKSGKNAIALNSHYKEKLLRLKVQQANIIDMSDSINLSIITPDFNRKYYECLIFVNDTLHAKEKCDSIISVSIRKPVGDIFLGFTADRTVDPLLASRALDTVYTEKLYPKADTFDKYTLRIIYNDSLFNYKVFDNEIFKITRKGLIFYDSKRKTRQTIPKK
jgi:hypothetical protein